LWGSPNLPCSASAFSLVHQFSGQRASTTCVVGCDMRGDLFYVFGAGVHCRSRMRRRVAVASSRNVVQPRRITRRHGGDHRGRGRCQMQDHRNDSVERRMRVTRQPWPHKHCLPRRREPLHQVAPGPFCLQALARHHSEHHGSGTRPEKRLDTRWPKAEAEHLQSSPQLSTVELPRPEF